MSMSFHQGSPCTTWWMNNRPVGGLSSETWSYPVDMIVNDHSMKESVNLSKIMTFKLYIQ
jgi:hypothetical protein